MLFSQRSLLRGDEAMCQALMEIMKPEIDEIVNMAVLQERRKTTERTIKATVKNLRRFNASDADIKTSLVEDFGLSEQEALSYLQ